MWIYLLLFCETGLYFFLCFPKNYRHSVNSILSCFHILKKHIFTCSEEVYFCFYTLCAVSVLLKFVTSSVIGTKQPKTMKKKKKRREKDGGQH